MRGWPCRGGLATIVGLVPLALLGCASPVGDRGAASDVAAVREVVEAFRLAIVHKDKPAYLALFFSDRPEAVGWQSVVDDPLLAKIRLERPQAIKARPRPENNFVALIDSVVASPVAEEERISNVEVDTDGEVAAVAFDYAYLSDRKVTNWGREQWLLVRTEPGWKIFSVVYTVREPASDGRRPNVP